MNHWLVPSRVGRRAVPALRGAQSLDAGLLDDFDRLFADVWRGFGLAGAAGAAGSFGGFSPRVDVRETADQIRILAELPGLEEKDFEVHLEGDVLTLKGEKREERDEEREGKRWAETRSGSFRRSFRIPFEVDADAVEARYAHGVLTVTLPKPAEAKPELRSIPVTS